MRPRPNVEGDLPRFLSGNGRQTTQSTMPDVMFFFMRSKRRHGQGLLQVRLVSPVRTSLLVLLEGLAHLILFAESPVFRILDVSFPESGAANIVLRIL
jgi:hypothetical protein